MRRSAPRRRRSYRKRGGRVSNRRILSVSSRKKYDHRLGSVTPGTLPMQLPYLAGSTYILSCPTYLEAFGNDSRYERDRQEIFFRGISERVFLSVRLHVTWRRVVFWSHERFVAAQPILVDPPTIQGRYYRRNLRPIAPNVGGANEDIGEFLWAGTVGTDYMEEDRAITPLDSTKVKVMSDRSVNINPNYNMGQQSFGKNYFTKRWHPVNSKIRYEQEEYGSAKSLDTGWATRNPQNPGNIYILDILYNGDAYNPDSQTEAGLMRVQSTVYWHER